MIRPLKYGITQEQYDSMLLQQDNACAICLSPSRIDRSLSIDHCHGSGRVRGLLCGGCNLGLGSFRDNSMALIRAANYLENNT